MYDLPSAAGRILLEILNQNNEINVITNQEALMIKNEVELVQKQINENHVTGAEGLALTKYRIGHGYFKSELLKVQDRCQICGLDLKVVLIASHIKPWSQSTSAEKVDHNNGLLLCPNHDRLFDQDLISFDDDGTLLVSAQIDVQQRDILNLNWQCYLTLSPIRREYLKWHRNKYNIIHKALI